LTVYGTTAATFAAYAEQSIAVSLDKIPMLHPLPKAILAHAILFHGLHERIPTTIVYRNKTEDISARCLPLLIKAGDLNVCSMPRPGADGRNIHALIPAKAGIQHY